MKTFLFLSLLLGLLFISSLYIAEEDNSLELEIKSIKHKDTSSLTILHEKFGNLDLNSQNLDLEQTIREIKEARKAYPLDDKLKMIDIELEHKRANKSYETTKNTTPDN